jgi:acetylornithine aminotransferase/acetylornithine/N-succinyldiaminopimelate aminotransferase
MNDFQKRAEAVLTPNYRRQPVMFVRGKGAKLWDSEGKEYLDFVAGIAAVNLGHCHPEVTRALRTQAKKLVHISNHFYIETQIELAELLVKNSSLDRVFFCNSGTEANEAALKLARRYSREKGKGGYEIISAWNSFHGRTFGSLSATGQEKFWKGFEPLVPGFKFVEFGNLEQMKSAINSNTCAVILEPVQGEGGVYPAPPGYLQGVRKLCDETGALLILDEVQTAMGRLGKLFGYEWADVQPDIITLAKALGNGFPIGAMLAKKDVAEALVPGTHASTFGGNPLASSAALATLKVILEDNLAERAQKIGEYFHSQLNHLKKNHPCIKEVRGVGLMLALELKAERCERVIEGMREKGFIINLTHNNVLRFLPSLLVKRKEISKMLSALDQELAKIDPEVI